MHRVSFGTLIAGCLLFAGIASAQLVQFPKGDAAWTVNITYPQSSAPTPTPQPAGGGNAKATPQASPKMKKIDIAQFGGQKRIFITWTDGHTSQEWTIPDLPVVFKDYPNGRVFPVGNGSMEHRYDDANMPANPSAFSWITPECLKQKDPVNFQGQMCYHYEGTSSAQIAQPRGNKGAGISIVKPEQAWIDSKTLLPVGLYTETSLCMFTFQPPPAGPLGMPQKFQEAISSYKHVMGF